MFDLAELEAELAGTVFAGNLHFAPVTESTNTDAMRGADRGAPHGSVWCAEEQTAGRGRAGHSWHSAAGDGLYVSVLLRHPRARSGPGDRAWLLLPLAAGLAAADAIREVSGIAIDLRWPNDLLVSDAPDAAGRGSARKVGGILIEAKTESRKPPYAVVGVGINVHQRTFPDDLATPATSLDIEAHARVSRQALLVALLKSLEREAAACADAALAADIPSRFERHSSWVCGRRVRVHGPQACAGVTAGLDEYGFVRVETPAGLVTVRTGGLRGAE